MKHFHKKPGGYYGYINFAKNEKVLKIITELPSDKGEQEQYIGHKFVELMNDVGRTLDKPIRLDENGHDFSTHENGEVVEVQVTELPASLIVDAVFYPQDHTWKSSSETGFYESLRNGNPMLIKNGDDYNNALSVVVKKKLDKKYSKNMVGKLWLLVWTLTHYETEYYLNGKLETSSSLIKTRQLLKANKHPFDEVWFTNLMTRPVKLFPS